jgi:Na+-transporting methylmalonyl-CoA/oxaloacetate decarboxylase gamma subunit
LFDGLVITAVGMLTVFAFLIVLVAVMALLRYLVARWSTVPVGASTPAIAAVVAATVAAIHHCEAPRARAGSSREGGSA